MDINEDKIKGLIDLHLASIDNKWKNSNSDTVEIPCFFCNDTKNLSISLSKQIYHCWVCGAKGTLQSLFFKYSSKQGLVEFNKYAKAFAKNKIQSKTINDLFFTEEYTPQVLCLPENSIYIQDAEKLDVYDHMFDYLLRRNITRELMYKLNVRFNLTNNTICFPSYDAHGNLNLFIERTVSDKGKYKITGDKSRIIFNEYLLDWNRPVTISEGIFDIARISNSIPLLGSELPTDFYLFKQLIFHKTPTVIILDNEIQTKKKLFKMCDDILNHCSEYPLFVGEINTTDNDIGAMTIINPDNFTIYKYDFEYKIRNSI